METETKTATTWRSSFHNTCGISRDDGGQSGICVVHSLPVYRDGIDWLELVA